MSIIISEDLLEDSLMEHTESHACISKASPMYEMQVLMDKCIVSFRRLAGFISRHEQINKMYPCWPSNIQLIMKMMVKAVNWARIVTEDAYLISNEELVIVSEMNTKTYDIFTKDNSELFIDYDTKTNIFQFINDTRAIQYKLSIMLEKEIMNAPCDPHRVSSEVARLKRMQMIKSLVFLYDMIGLIFCALIIYGKEIENDIR